MPDRYTPQYHPDVPDELWQYFGHTPPKPPSLPELSAQPESTNVIPISSGNDKRRYLTILARECDKLASTASGRNDQLNQAAFDLAGFVAAGHLTREEVEDALLQAGRQASARGDHPFTENEMRATIRSAFSSPKVTPKSLPERGPQVIEVEPGSLQPSAKDDEGSQDLHRLAVTRRAYEFRVNDEARALWTRQRAAMAGQQRPPLVNLVELLAQPDEDVQFRIDELLPVGGRALLAAQYKAGKTSMIANLLRSLVDGDRFLMRFSVAPIDHVVLIDTELDERMLRRWLRDQGIKKQSAIDVLCLRGRLNSFDITNDVVRADWAQAINGADFIILDCLRPCLDALGLSEDKEAGIFLTAFDALCREAGAAEGAVVHHMGHGQERSRGDSRLLDWPDVLWKIIRDDEEGDGGDRFFSALGRDVNIPESRLDWNPQTRGLALCEGGRAEKRARNQIVDIIEIMSDPANKDGLSQTRLVGKLKALGSSRDGSRRAVQMAIAEGILLTVEGPRNSTVHVLNPSRRS
jgi:hypothetical protein